MGKASVNLLYQNTFLRLQLLLEQILSSVLRKVVVLQSVRTLLAQIATVALV